MFSYDDSSVIVATQPIQSLKTSSSSYQPMVFIVARFSGLPNRAKAVNPRTPNCTRLTLESLH